MMVIPDEDLSLCHYCNFNHKGYKATRWFRYSGRHVQWVRGVCSQCYESGMIEHIRKSEFLSELTYDEASIYQIMTQ